MTSSRLAAALAALLVAAPLLAGCGSEEATAFSGTTLEEPFEAPDIDLVDTEGQPFSLAADTQERLTLVFFGYTNCPDICPMVLANLTSAMTRLSAEDREQVEVVFVTTDPTRDTGPVLRRYLDGFDESFVGLTGPLPTIIAVGEPLAVYVNDGEKLPTGGYDLGGHTTSVVGVDGDDQAPVYWDDDTSSAEFAADIHTLLEG